MAFAAFCFCTAAVACVLSQQSTTYLSFMMAFFFFLYQRVYTTFFCPLPFTTNSQWLVIHGSV